jgi:tRNA threonylcarbamoyladenosine biosynthesis protein TsaE
MTFLDEPAPPVIYSLADEAAMLVLGARLARALRPGVTLYLEGDLGVGKTTLCRGVLRGFGHSGAVKSPTYTLVEPYEFTGFTVSHFDLYRLGDPSELDYIGIRDYFDPQSLCLIEWPERGCGFLPPADLVVRIELEGGGRLLTMTATTSAGSLVVERLGGVEV